jgi:hypothetical protein
MEKLYNVVDIFFLEHLWISRKDICGAATENSNYEVHNAGK